MSNEINEKLIDKIDHEIVKIPLFEKMVPHIFIQNALYEDRFRFSTSYSKLNKSFNIKIEIFRDLSNLKKNIKHTIFDKRTDKYLNNYFVIKENMKTYDPIFYYNQIERIKVHEKNNIIIEKIRFNFDNNEKTGNSSIIVITKKYGDNRLSQGLFFASDTYHNIDLFMKEFLNRKS